MARQTRIGRNFLVEVDENGERVKRHKPKLPPPHISPETGEIEHPPRQVPETFKSLFANGKRPVKEEDVGEAKNHGKDKDKNHGND